MPKAQEGEWPPSNLPAYYESAGFLARLKSLQRRLSKKYRNADAEVIVYDVVADVMLKEIELHAIYDTYLHRFPSERHLIRYIYEASCRRVIDHARSFQRRFRQLLEEDGVADMRPGPEAVAIESEERRRGEDLVEELNKSVINKLPKLDRLILKHRIDGSTFQEIANMLDIGVSTVHRRHRAVIKQLAKQLAGTGRQKKHRPTP